MLRKIGKIFLISLPVIIFIMITVLIILSVCESKEAKIYKNIVAITIARNNLEQPVYLFLLEKGYDNEQIASAAFSFLEKVSLVVGEEKKLVRPERICDNELEKLEPVLRKMEEIESMALGLKQIKKELAAINAPGSEKAFINKKIKKIDKIFGNKIYEYIQSSYEEDYYLLRQLESVGSEKKCTNFVNQTKNTMI